MINNDNDQFSKLLADSQVDFERDVMSLKGTEKPQEPTTLPELHASAITRCVTDFS